MIICSGIALAATSVVYSPGIVHHNIQTARMHILNQLFPLSLIDVGWSQHTFKGGVNKVQTNPRNVSLSPEAPDYRIFRAFLIKTRITIQPWI